MPCCKNYTNEVYHQYIYYYVIEMTFYGEGLITMATFVGLFSSAFNRMTDKTSIIWEYLAVSPYYHYAFWCDD